MINRYNRLLLPIFYLIDFLLVLASYFIAYQLRFQNEVTKSYSGLFIIYSVIWLLSSFICKSYIERQAHNFIWHLRRLGLTQIIFIGFAFIYLVASKSHFISRRFLLIFFLFEVFILFGWHVVRRQLTVWYRSKGKNYRSVIVMGDIERVSHFSAWANDNPEYGYRVDCSICYDDSRKNYARSLRAELKRTHYDELIILTGGSFGVMLENQIQWIIDEAENFGLRVMIAPSYMRNYAQRFEIDNLNGQTVLSVRYEPLLYLHNRLLKRLFDFLLSTLIFLLIYWWFYLVVATLIKLSSRGLVLFRQKRVGINDKTFTCYKFRTMRYSSDNNRDPEDGFGEITLENDNRITWIGRLLRKSNLDELPQLINVIIGNMSLVGPVHTCWKKI